MAVASNKYQAATGKLIDRYFPAGTFAAVHGQREEIPPKPDPTIVRNILTETGSTSADTLYVGDSSVDMRTAANSGLRSVAVTWGFRPRKELEENGAMFVIDRPRNNCWRSSGRNNTSVYSIRRGPRGPGASSFLSFQIVRYLNRYPTVNANATVCMGKSNSSTLYFTPAL